MMKLRKSFCLLLVLSIHAHANAQVQTLKDSAQQAILSNPDVLARWHTFESANSERDAGAGAYLPRVDLSASAGRDRLNDTVRRTDLHRTSKALTLTQMLYDGFATSNDVDRLDHMRLVRLYELYDTSESVALEVVRAYSDVLRYRKLVSLAEENYVRHQAVFTQIERKTQAGVSRRVDLEQIAGRLALAEANLLTEVANLHDVGARFQRLVGVAPGKELENLEPLTKGMPPDIRAALNAATKYHPALQASIENIHAADSAAGTRRAAYQPRLDFRMRSEKANNLDGVAGNTNNNTAEVVMTWNLFNGLSDRSRVQQYADQLNVARDLRDKTCRDIHQTLLIAYNDTRKLTEQMTFLDQHQLSIEKARDAYRKQFDIGQRSLLDLLDTENELFQSKRAYANAEYDLILAYARTHAGMGTLNAALGLSRQDGGALPDFASRNNDADAVQNCPAEVPEAYVIDKARLNERAQEFVLESTPAGTEQTDSPVTAGQKKAFAEALKAWNVAWQTRNIQAYLDFYADTFTPANNLSKKAWLAQRKSRIGNAVIIELGITDLKVSMPDAKHVITTFIQSYRSAVYHDVVKKTLEWEDIGGRWLIVKEVAESADKR